MTRRERAGRVVQIMFFRRIQDLYLEIASSALRCILRGCFLSSLLFVRAWVHGNSAGPKRLCQRTAHVEQKGFEGGGAEISP